MPGLRRIARVTWQRKTAGMDHYLISFPSSAMKVSEEDLPEVAAQARAVIAEMKDAGVYRFGGGIDESEPPVMVTGHGSVVEATYEETRRIEGGYTVITVETRDEAVRWAAKVAEACRCAQELRKFQYDPAS